MLDMQASGRAVILHAQPQLPALGVGQADEGLHQVAIGQARAVALELDGE